MSHFIIGYSGNKRSDIKHFCDFFPDDKEYNKVIEPFCGSCAVSFYLNKESVLNDINNDLIKLLKLQRDEDLNKFHIKVLNYYDTIKDLDIKEIRNDINKNKENDKIKLYFHYKFLRYLNFNTKDRIKLPKTTKKIIKFSNFLKKCELLNKDYIEVFKKYGDDENNFIFLDPPYFQSCNSYYSNAPTNSNFKDGLKEIDDTKIFIDILELLKKKCKVMLIINDNYITRYLYKDYIKEKYLKKYSNNIKINDKYFKKYASHLIVTNY